MANGKEVPGIVDLVVAGAKQLVGGGRRAEKSIMTHDAAATRLASADRANSSEEYGTKGIITIVIILSSVALFIWGGFKLQELFPSLDHVPEQLIYSILSGVVQAVVGAYVGAYVVSRWIAPMDSHRSDKSGSEEERQ